MHVCCNIRHVLQNRLNTSKDAVVVARALRIFTKISYFSIICWFSAKLAELC